MQLRLSELQVTIFGSVLRGAWLADKSCKAHNRKGRQGFAKDAKKKPTGKEHERIDAGRCSPGHGSITSVMCGALPVGFTLDWQSCG